jgi:L-lysine 6-monooxygenase (NADPH-requiring)
MTAHPSVDDSDGLLIAGVGPAGMALLATAEATGALDRWLDRGLHAVDPTGDASGQLGCYAVRSDTTGRVFAEVSRSALPNPDANEASLLAECDSDSPVPLATAANLLRAAARPTLAAAASALVNGTVTGLRPVPDGVEVTIQTPSGTRSVRAQRVAVAIGGRPWITPELANLRPDAVHSDAVIRRTVTGTGRVVVIGGSHSAFSAVRVLLDHGQVDAVTVVHRSPVRVTYDDPAAAAADGCRFGPDDVDAATGRVFRFGGLRTDSADLYRAIRDGAEPRVTLTSWPPDPDLIASTELIVAATGYTERVSDLLPAGFGSCVFDNAGALRAGGRPVPGIFGIGLGAGRRRDAETGGEKSFTATIDGVWFYRNVVAPVLVERLTSA